MTDYEKAVVTAYTGKAMLAGEKMGIFRGYIEKLLGRPVYTHDLAEHAVWEEIKEKSKNDFIKLCKDELDEPRAKWIPVSPLTDTVMCNMCGSNIPNIEMATPHCPWCGLPMEEVECK